MDFRKFLEISAEAELLEAKKKKESTSEKDHKAEKAGKKVAKDIEYDEGHKGKDDKKAEKAGKKVTKDIEYDDKKDKKKSLKDWFELIDKNMLAEAEQITMEPAKQNTQVIKQGTKTLGTVSNPALAAQIKGAIGKGEMNLAGHEIKEEELDEKVEIFHRQGPGADMERYHKDPNNPAAVASRKAAADAAKKLRSTGDLKSKKMGQEIGTDAGGAVKPVSTSSQGFKKGSGMVEQEMEESGLQAYLGKKKYGKEGMAALQKAGRDGASKEKMAKIRAQHDKIDEADKPNYWVHDEKEDHYYGPYGSERSAKEGGRVGPGATIKKFPGSVRNPRSLSPSDTRMANARKGAAAPGTKMNEKAVSKAQQKFMGMVHAAQKGEKAASKEVGDVAKTMKKKDVKDFAQTKHKGLPEKKKKVKEAERPSDQVDMGAGLGAGRNDKVLEAKPDFLDLDKDGNKKEPMKKAAADKKKQKVKESMNHKLMSAKLRGKAHALAKESYNNKFDEGSDERRSYHEGYVEGLDECYGMGGKQMPVQGLVVGETMPAATVPGMAQQAMDENLTSVGMSDDRAAKIITDKLKGMPGINTGNIDKYVSRYLGMVGKHPTDLKHLSVLVFGNLQDMGLAEADLDEMNKTDYMKHKAQTTPGNTFKAFGQTHNDSDVLEADVFAFESLDKQLNDLLNEGISVNMSQGLGGAGGQVEDSVSVTAQGDDAAKLLDFIKQVGLGGLGSDKAAQPAEVVAVASDYGAPKFDSGSSDMAALLKKVGVDDGEDYKDEGDHEHDHGGPEVCGTHGVAEEKCGCGEGKEMVDEVESEDQMEYEVAEDNAGQDEEEMTTADEKAEAEEDLTKPASGGAVTEGGDGGEASEESDGDTAGDAGEGGAEDVNEATKLDEWANDAGKKGTDAAFEADIEFMTNVISSGLNKKKSTGQTTIPVIPGQKDRTGVSEDADVAEFKRLAGIR